MIFPFSVTAAPPPKIFAVVAATLPIACCVKYNCEPFMVSVELKDIRPAATLVIVLSLPSAPILTVAIGFVPAKSLYVIPFTVAFVVGMAIAVTELLPSAIESVCSAVAFRPIAVALKAEAFDDSPIAIVR